jgi:hypothetical protein
LIHDILHEAGDLLGGDAGELTLPDDRAARLNLPPGATYAGALAAVLGGGSRVQARDLTGAILALRDDPRVQGAELLPQEVAR